MSTNLKVPSTLSADPVKVRTWAQANGFDVSERGRLSHTVRDAFNKSHKGFGSHKPGQFVRPVVGVIGHGKKARKINAAAARALLIENELPVPARGPLGGGHKLAALTLVEGGSVADAAKQIETWDSQANVDPSVAVLRAALVADGREVGSRGRLTAQDKAEAKLLLRKA